MKSKNPFSEIKTPIQYIWTCLKPHKFWFILTLTMVAIAQAISIGYTFYVRELINVIDTHGTESLELIWYLTIIILLFYTSENVFWRTSGLAGNRCTNKATKESYDGLFSYITQHNIDYFNNRLAGKILSKITNTSEAFHKVLPTIFWNLFRVGIQIIVALWLLSLESFWLTLYCGFWILVLIIINLLFARRQTRFSLEGSEAGSELRGVIVDVITNITNAKMNTGLQQEINRVETTSEIYKQKSIKSWLFSELNLSVNDVALTFFSGGGLVLSVYLWSIGQVSLGGVIMLIIITGALWDSLGFLGQQLNNFFQSLGEIKEGINYLLVTPKLKDPDTAEKSRINKGQIDFNNVGFNYEETNEKHIFKGFQLKIPAGQKVGIVGESGAGKSTFVNLLLRFMDVTDGAISIDGQDIRNITQDDLRKNIAYVPQEPMLFHRSLRDNILYSNPSATEAELIGVARQAHAHGFISELSEGYDTLVGERGIKLSGGQKQRVAIARAMLKNSPILILDEATSALDSSSEQLIQDSFKELMKGRTTIVIAHRLSTLNQMDRIIVMDKGVIIEDGTHEELLALKGQYANLWNHQSGGFIS